MAACGGGGGGGHKGGIHTVSLVNGQAADAVIGQADMYNGDANQGGSASKYTVNWPYGSPGIADGHLFIPDNHNNRVLGFNSIPTVNNAPADFVLGQPDFTNTSSGLSRWSLHYPENVVTDNGKLFVIDSYNSRVLVWNTVPTTNGVAADIVLGQGDFTSCDANRGAVSPSRNSLAFPYDAWSDGKKLVIADNDNHRVLIWNTFPTISNTPPDVVVGQADFTSRTTETEQDRLADPTRISSNGKQLFVADYNSNRIVVWNNIPTINNTPADVVLGQTDFTSSAPGLGPALLNGPGGVLVHGDQLFVSDSDNNRVLIFNGK